MVDSIDLPAGGADESQCSRRFDSVVLDALQEQTLELATVIRAVGVNTATTAIKSRARLGELASACVQAKISQCNWIVACLESDVGEDDAVAAEAAFEAKVRRRFSAV